MWLMAAKLDSAEQCMTSDQFVTNVTRIYCEVDSILQLKTYCSGFYALALCFLRAVG